MQCAPGPRCPRPTPSTQPSQQQCLKRCAPGGVGPLGHQVLHHIVAVLVVAQLQRGGQHLCGRRAGEGQVAAGRQGLRWGEVRDGRPGQRPPKPNTKALGLRSRCRAAQALSSLPKPRAKLAQPTDDATHPRSRAAAARGWSRTRARAAPGGSQRCAPPGSGTCSRWSAVVGLVGGRRGWRGDGEGMLGAGAERT